MDWDFTPVLDWLDLWLDRGTAPFACWVLLNTLDDLVIDVAWLFCWLGENLLQRPLVPYPFASALDRAPVKRIAILVPLWREYQVIQGMIEHNIAAIRYSQYEIFIGAYPNDSRTIEAVRALEHRFSQVHLALCPHDGPTSKADNLNSIFDAMTLYEREHGGRPFDLVMTHDAEDLLHPESLRWVNYYSQSCEMVQVPVLPLPTPWWQVTHGVYCDEFAEYQSKELQARQLLGGFLPSCGVGTAFSRAVVERIRRAGKTFFDPRSLTEDYENGFRVWRLGGRQIFVPIRKLHGTPVATREYFPRTFRQAVRQRTRWITGISLQSWELHGWADTISQLYWFWRDRKGLIASLLGPFSMALFFHAFWKWCCSPGGWHLSLQDGGSWILAIFVFAIPVQLAHVGMRVLFVARIYGLAFGLAAPLRLPLGAVINFLATVSAVGHYAKARLLRRPLEWLKTEHSYPGRAALAEHKRKLGEILVDWGFLRPQDLETALLSRPYHRRLGEHLVTLGYVTESQLYRALSHQQGIPVEHVPRSVISVQVTRSLPHDLALKWRVLPFQVEGGQLCLAGPELPSDRMREELSRHSSLNLHFHWIMPADYDALRREFLPDPV
ncbi:MAG: glycosyl transferase family protein [Bryobacteraceae bacterium]